MSSNAATFAEERRAAILDMLEYSASVQVSDLARTFGVSAVTARADLDALEAAGKLRRTHGGAVSLQKALTVSIQDKRINLNVAAKQAIAQAAIGLVEDGDSIIVDSGTTALEFVRVLTTRRDITVITADVTIANYIDDSLPQTDVILLGGTLRKGHRYLYGPLALRALEVLHADKAFLCPTSFVPNRGLMTNFEQMAQIKSAFIEAASTSIALIDATKVDAGGLMLFAPLEKIDILVIDHDPEGIVAHQIESCAKRGGHAPQLMLASNQISAL